MTLTQTQKTWIGAGIVAAGMVALWTLVVKADAADLGGNCCSDLEERIAELEATTARKGNKKVAVTIYGTVNKALLFYDLDGESDQRIIENTASESRVAFVGEAKFEKGWAAGFVIEVGIGRWDILTDIAAVSNSSEIYTRQSAVYLTSPAGKVSLGLTSEASDGIAELTTANTGAVVRSLSLRPLLGGDGITENLDLFDGQRLNVLRYDSPAIAGFIVSASWSQDGTDLGTGQSDVWDVAVRWAGEFSGFRAIAGVAYRDGAVFPGAAPIIPIGVVAFDQDTVSGSASLMHMGTGLFVTAAAGKADLGGTEIKGLHITPGIEKNWFGLGPTTLYGEWMRWEIDGGGEIEMYGFGAVQAINNAATDIYLNYRNLDLGGDEDVDTWMTGARVKF